VLSLPSCLLTRASGAQPAFLPTHKGQWFNLPAFSQDIDFDSLEVDDRLLYDELGLTPEEVGLTMQTCAGKSTCFPPASSTGTLSSTCA
jgi:hypothetical protein